MKDRNEPIKIIALDLDGTTLNSHKEISARTLAAFKEAMKQGVHIVISTGRTFHSLPKQIFSIEGLEYVVTSNGALITELPSRQILYEKYIAPHAVEQIAELLDGTGLSIETFVHGKAYIDQIEFDEVVKNGSNYRDADYIKETRNPVSHICEYMLTHKENIENISINFEYLEEKEKWKEILQQVSDITLTSSFPHNFEIGAASSSKGEALRYLMKQLGLTRNQLMAAGDSPNDLEMLKLASVGVVMGNASDEMKSHADYVTDSNDRDGVAKAIERFVLES